MRDPVVVVFFFCFFSSCFEVLLKKPVVQFATFAILPMYVPFPTEGTPRYLEFVGVFLKVFLQLIVKGNSVLCSGAREDVALVAVPRRRAQSGRMITSS